MFNIENSKQMEFLNKIRNVGMSIVCGQLSENDVVNSFIEFDEYIDNPTSEEISPYADKIIKLNYLANTGKLNNPDDLLLQLGKYVPKIEYENTEMDNLKNIIDNYSEDEEYYDEDDY